MATIIRGKNLRKPYTVRYRDQGKQRERSFRTWREANDFRVRFEHESREQSYVDPRLASERFRDVAQLWLARHPGAPATKGLYDSVLRNHILPAIGDRSLASVAKDRDGIQTLLLVTLPANGAGASLVRTAYRIITAIVSDAVKSRRLPTHSLGGIKLPPIATRAEFIFPSFAQLKP